MKKVFRKPIKVIAIIIVLLFTGLMIIPILFQDKIISAIKETVNNQINADVDFKNINLSLFKNFPNLALDIHDLTVINQKSFEGDTLASIGEISLKLSLSTLFKDDDDPYEVQQISIRDARIHIIVNAKGFTNYDITKTITEEIISSKQSLDTETPSDLDESIRFALKEYSLNNIDLVYEDISTKLKFTLDDLYHSGSGDFTTSVFNLNTTTKAQVSLNYENINYLNKNNLSLNAAIGIDLNKNTYTFLKNTFILNRLKLNFEGYIQTLYNGQDFHLSFDTPSTNFLSFLEMIPAKYTKSLEGMHTKGSFAMKGKAEGVLDSLHIPTFTVDVIAKNAMFQYPNLPKSVEDINLNAHIVNTTGLLDDTLLTIPNLIFRIGSDRFATSARLTNLIKNITVQSVFKGTINLSDVTKIYPLEEPLSGKLNMDVKANFDMAMIDNKQYEKADIDGKLSLSDFNYKSQELPHPINIAKANINFTPHHIILSAFEASSGSSDFQVKGNVDNLLGFVFRDENIEGYFRLDSRRFDVGDFVELSTTTDIDNKEDNPSEDDSSIIKTNESFRIPAFLNCTLDTHINKVIYDNLILNKLTGTVILKNQNAVLKSLKFNTLEGKITMNGKVQTKNTPMTFDSQLKVDRLSVQKSFSLVETLKKIAPIADAIDGLFNAGMHFNGTLNNDYTPNTESLDGSMSLNLFKAKFTPDKSNLINSLNNKVSFLNLEKSNLTDINIDMEVKDSKVLIKPFEYRQDDIEGMISGSHGFDQQINYTISTNLPIHYLGGDINNLIDQTNDLELKNTKVPLKIGISGKMTKPKIHMDMKPATQMAKQKLLEHGKKRAKEEIKDFAKKQMGDALNNFLDGNKKEDNKKKKEGDKNKVDELIDNLFK